MGIEVFNAHDAGTAWPEWASNLSLQSSSFLPMAERSAPAQASGEGGMRMTDRGGGRWLPGDSVRTS